MVTDRMEEVYEGGDDLDTESACLSGFHKSVWELSNSEFSSGALYLKGHYSKATFKQNLERPVQVSWDMQMNDKEYGGITLFAERHDGSHEPRRGYQIGIGGWGYKHVYMKEKRGHKTKGGTSVLNWMNIKVTATLSETTMNFNNEWVVTEPFESWESRSGKLMFVVIPYRGG
jgi:hypothetical protein